MNTTIEINENISFLLKDNREVCSPNMKRFFKNKRNRHECEVIIFDGSLWFASLGWRTSPGNDDGFAGNGILMTSSGVASMG